MNKQKIERLTAEGKMHTSGIKMVELAKEKGTWDALNQVEMLEIPTDLEVCLALYPPAASHFAAFPRSVKRGILEWILNAKKPETRKARVEETAKLAAQNIRANQFPRIKPS